MEVDESARERGGGGGTIALGDLGNGSQSELMMLTLMP